MIAVRRERLAAALCAAGDLAAVLSYLFGWPLELVYVGALLFKLSLGWISGWPGLKALPSVGTLLVVIVIVVLVSILFGHQRISPIGPMLNFCLQVSATVLVVRARDFSLYAKSCALLGAAIGSAYVAMVSVGMITEEFGRFTFFGGAHYNLGSEILAVCFIMAGLSLSGRALVACSVISVIAVMYMQGRAALLVIVLVLLMRGYEAVRQARPISKLLALLFLLVPLLVYSQSLIGAVNVAFLLDDQYRGVGTGVVGREERWSQAWETFTSQPITGQGFGYHVISGVDSPHSAALYALAELGMLSALVGVSVLWMLWNVQPRRLMWLLIIPAVPLLVLNDRFINSNPYPLLLYVAIVILGQGKSSSSVKQDGEVLR